MTARNVAADVSRGEWADFGEVGEFSSHKGKQIINICMERSQEPAEEEGRCCWRPWFEAPWGEREPLQKAGSPPALGGARLRVSHS